MSSQHTVDFVRRGVAQRKPLEKICEDMMDRCLAPDSDCSGVGCDNMTVMVVALLRGRTLDQWYDHVGQKVLDKVGYETPELEDLPQPFRERPAAAFGSEDRAGRLGGGGGLASIIRGNSILYNTGSTPDDDEEHGAGEEEDEDEQSLLSNLQAALRREGIRIASLHPGSEDDDADADGDDRFESMDVDEHETDSEGGKADPPAAVAKPNDEVPPPAVQAEGLMDKSEDPLKAAA
jgi:protein phosphatase 2C family protein 2/3